MIGLSNTIMVIFFLSDINLFIFLPLDPAIYRIGNKPKILFRRGKEQGIGSTFIARFPKLL